MFGKVPVLLDCPSAPLEEFIAIDDDNVCTAPIIAGQRHSGACSKLKTITNANSEYEKKMNPATPVPTSSEMRNIMKKIYTII
ncbi:hypothetical protein TNCV_1287831 [Trichonephila clavipes]|nr:hypothetical protein TNCV_1287831 [Trichonephila clavipes]